MKKREKINLTDTWEDVVSKLSEGNPGALSVCMQVMDNNQMNVFTLLHLDDMNMRGSQIWVAYKDWAGEDIEKFKKGITSRNKEMISLVNRESGSEHHAVISRRV